MKKYLSHIIEEAEGYAEAKLESARLEAVDKSISLLTGIMSWLVLAGMMLLMFMCITLIVIITLSHLTGGYLSAALIVLGFYLLLFVPLFVFKKKLLLRPIKNFLLGEYLHTYKSKSNG